VLETHEFAVHGCTFAKKFMPTDNVVVECDCKHQHGAVLQHEFMDAHLVIQFPAFYGIETFMTVYTTAHHSSPT
jgi:hypothetical protein